MSFKQRVKFAERFLKAKTPRLRTREPVVEVMSNPEGEYTVFANDYMLVASKEKFDVPHGELFANIFKELFEFKGKYALNSNVYTAVCSKYVNMKWLTEDVREEEFKYRNSYIEKANCPYIVRIGDTAISFAALHLAHGIINDGKAVKFTVYEHPFEGVSFLTDNSNSKDAKDVIVIVETSLGFATICPLRYVCKTDIGFDIDEYLNVKERPSREIPSF